MLTDIEQGHWSLWQDKANFKYPMNYKIDKKMVARNPKSSILNGVVGIDFGTKSTVVAYQKDSTKVYPMRVGTGNLAKSISAQHYENPTIMEFNDLEQFVEAYQARDGRPYTSWEDLTISHTAFSSLMNSKRKGILKSLPQELHNQAGEVEKLSVKKGASEPAAYAIVALQEYGFEDAT